jgi:hypothetical protein
MTWILSWLLCRSNDADGNDQCDEQLHLYFRWSIEGVAQPRESEKEAQGAKRRLWLGPSGFGAWKVRPNFGSRYDIWGPRRKTPPLWLGISSLLSTTYPWQKASVSQTKEAYDQSRSVSPKGHRERPMTSFLELSRARSLRSESRLKLLTMLGQIQQLSYDICHMRHPRFNSIHSFSIS